MKSQYDYYLNSEPVLLPGIWIFLTPKKPMLLCSLNPREAGKVADEAPRGTGSAGGSRLKATAQFGAKKDIHIPISVSCVLK